MDVSHLEARALTGEAAGPQGAQPPLVGELRQRIRLIHELRQLGAAEERLDDRAHRPGVDQIVERDLLGIVVDAHPLLDQSRHSGEPDRELVGDQLAHRPHATVAEMIDVVRVPARLGQLEQVANDRDEIIPGEHGFVERDV